MTIGVAIGHAAAIMLDRSKGSMTNRAQCAKEHFKNDMKTGLKIGTVGAGAVGVAYAAKHSPKVAKAVTYGAKTIGKAIGHSAKKVGAKDFATKLLKNPLGQKRLGALAVGIAAGAYVLDTLFNYANKAGRINQKYEDAAKIEGTTKNVVLDA